MKMEQRNGSGCPGPFLCSVTAVMDWQGALVASEIASNSPVGAMYLSRRDGLQTDTPLISE